MINAFVLSRVIPSNEDEVLSKIRNISAVSEANIVHGKYDLIAKINVDKIEDLKNVVFEEVRKIQHLEKTCTLVVADINTISE